LTVGLVYVKLLSGVVQCEC